MKSTTFTTSSGMTYSITGTRYFKSNGNGKKTRISKTEYELAVDLYEKEMDPVTANAPEDDMTDDERQDIEDLMEMAEREQAELDAEPSKVESGEEIAINGLMNAWTESVTAGDFTHEDMAQSLTEQVERNCQGWDSSAEEMECHPELAKAMGIDPEDPTDEQIDEWLGVVTEAAKRWLKENKLDDAAEDENVSLEEFCEMLSEDEKTAVEPAEAELLNNVRKEKKTKGEAKKTTRKPRKSKDIAYEGHGVTLTAKQVDFIQHLPDTCFWENGLDSTPWCDVLADEIGGQFEGKPMTTGAMISTICEKGLATRAKAKVNGKKATYLALTELGKEVAKELGLE